MPVVIVPGLCTGSEKAFGAAASGHCTWSINR